MLEPTRMPNEIEDKLSNEIQVRCVATIIWLGDGLFHY